jgi:uncharacterized protein YjbI with pentapeptide repeats
VHAVGTNFQGADLHGLDSGGGNYTQANFGAADLSNAGLDNPYFRGANLHFVNINHTLLSGAQLPDADLTGAYGTPYTDSSTVFSNTGCPDGTNSDSTPAHNCDGHYLP